MGLLGKIFTGKGSQAPAAPAQQGPDFQESDTHSDTDRSRDTHRRELLQVVLRDTMRQHGIPSDWIDFRLVPGVLPNRSAGLHAQFIVRDGQDRLLTYVFAFQESFKIELARMDPRFPDWLISLGWEFPEDGHGHRKMEMPRPSTWGAAATAAYAEGASESEFALEEDHDQEQDFSRGGESTAPMPLPESAQELERTEVEDDLAALYAAMKKASAPAALDPDDQPDFEPTRPGDN